MTQHMYKLATLGGIGFLITTLALGILKRAGASDVVLLPCATAGFTVSFVLMELRVVRKPAMVLALAGYSAAFAALLIWYKELGIPGWLAAVVGFYGGLSLIIFFSRRLGGHWKWK
jgi:hypothetical protein